MSGSSSQRHAVEADAAGLTLALVVVFQNEERFLPLLLGSLDRQGRKPDIVALVDDGSSDSSGAIADAYAVTRSWVSVIHRAAGDRPTDRLSEAHELRAFLDAVGTLGAWDVVAKMDADLDLTPRTLEAIMEAFRREPRLGMAGARLSELANNGSRVPLVSRPEHVEGATKFYRRECWEAISPIPPILGWDTVDEFTARLRGWQTRSITVPEGDPVHMRRMGTHGRILRSFRRWGVCSYGYGSHPVHVLFYGGRLMVTRRPYVIGGANFLLGWGNAVAHRAPRAAPDVRRAMRQEQLGRMRARARALWCRTAHNAS